MEITLSPQQWLTLKPATRQALVKIFRIPRSSSTHVINDGGRHHVESDGHTYEDLKTISLEEMKRLTNSPSENFFEQFELIIKMVEEDGSQSANFAQPENATQNVTSTASGTPEGSDKQAAGTDSGAKEGDKSEAPVSQEQVLPVPGGEQQVSGGRDELLPNPDNNNPAVVATKDEEVNSKKPGVGKTSGSKTRGL